jgi:nitrogen fixation/metabolism regulation signal transduction histidine kinase
MSVLHQMVPMFFLIQFVVVLVALVVAMLFADSQFSLPARKSCRRATSHVFDGSRN